MHNVLKFFFFSPTHEKKVTDHNVQDRQCTYNARDIKAFSRNQSCRGKLASFKYYESVFAVLGWAYTRDEIVASAIESI